MEAAPPAPRPPFRLGAGLLALAVFLTALALLAGDFVPPGMGWPLLLAALGCMLLLLLPRATDAADPAGASFVPVAGAVGLALLLYNGIAGAARTECEVENLVVVSFSKTPDVVLLRPLEDSRQYAFRSTALRRELAGLEAAQLAARLRYMRSFGRLRGIELLQLGGAPQELRALGWIDEDGSRHRARD